MADKRIEKAYLKEYLMNSGYDERDISIVNFEEPDFIVTLNGMSLAVEITEFYQGEKTRKGSRTKAMEEIWKEIRLQLQTGSSKGKISHANVVCLPLRRNGQFHAPRRREIKDFVDQLSHFVTGKLVNLPVGEDVKIARDKFLKTYPIVGTFIREIYIANLPHKIPVNWHFTQLTGGTIGNMSDEINAIIQNKMEKVSRYRDNIRTLDSNIIKLCLLIVASGDTPSTAGDFKKDRILKMADEKEVIFKDSGFDQIWYLSGIPIFSLCLYPQS